MQESSKAIENVELWDFILQLDAVEHRTAGVQQGEHVWITYSHNFHVF